MDIDASLPGLSGVGQSLDLRSSRMAWPSFKRWDAEGRREAERMLRQRLLALEARGGGALSQLVDKPESELVAGHTGGPFTVKSSAFWDIQPLTSDLFVEVEVVAAYRRRRRRVKSGLVIDPYTDEITRYANFPRERIRSTGVAAT